MTMATIAENLQTIKDSVEDIKQAIIAKGGSISGDITTFADAINEISGGGSTEPEYIFTGTASLDGAYLHINGTLNKSPYPDFTTGVCKIVVILLDEYTAIAVGSDIVSPDNNAVYNISLNIGESSEAPKKIPMFLLTYTGFTQVKFVQQT
jgi:hypothetical protein